MMLIDVGLVTFEFGINIEYMKDKKKNSMDLASLENLKEALEKAIENDTKYVRYALDELDKALVIVYNGILLPLHRATGKFESVIKVVLSAHDQYENICEI